MLIAMLSFSESLATKSVSLNDEPCTIRPTLIDLDPVEGKCCPFMISLDKYSGSCNVLSPKICVPKRKQRTNVKALKYLIW